jgi:AcrR family transcriptional regulator
VTNRKGQRATEQNVRRTRGGWTPVGTAASRRAEQELRSTARGKQSRRAIIDAARRVFEESGYFDATIEQIVAEAGVARGSFYTYFPSKLKVFQVVAAEVTAQVMDSVDIRRPSQSVDPRVNLDQANRRYLQAYRENARAYGLIEQVATTDPWIHELRLKGRHRHVERVATTIQRWQIAGFADPEVDPTTMAAALVSMTSYFAYWWFVGGDTYDEELATQTLNDIWIRSTGLRPRPRTPKRPPAGHLGPRL